MKSRSCRVKKFYNKTIKDAAVCLSKNESDESMKLPLTYFPHAEKQPELVTILLDFT